MQAAPPFSFTKGCPVMKIAGRWGGDSGHNFRTELYDVQDDPQQRKPLDDPQLERRMIGLLVQAMKDSDAPAEQYERLGLREYI